MINSKFKIAVTNTLGIDQLDTGRFDVRNKAGEIIGHIGIVSYIAMQVRYRFGLASFVIIETPKHWLIGLFLQPLIYPFDNLDSTTPNLVEFITVDTIELPIFDTLRHINLYPETVVSLRNDHNFILSAEIRQREIMSDFIVHSYVKDKSYGDLWRSLQLTIEKVAKLIDTENTRSFLEKNSKHLSDMVSDSIES